MRRILMIGGAVFGAALLAVAALAPTASAEEGDVILGGQGTLSAHGNGIVALKGRVELAANANRGVLMVKDLAGDADIDVRGVGGSATWNGFEVYYGAGAAHITGSHVAVIIVGVDIDLRAHGKGWAFLQGRGSYWVNGHGPFAWDLAGGFASVDDGGADPPPEAPAN